MIGAKDLTAAERTALADCTTDEERAFCRELFQLARLGVWARNFAKPALEKYRLGPKAVGYIHCGHKFSCNCPWKVLAQYAEELLKYAGLYEAPRERPAPAPAPVVQLVPKDLQ